MSYINAVNDMFLLFNDTWSNECLPIIGYTPKVEWQGVQSDGVDNSKYFARISQQGVTDRQRTLKTSKNRYDVTGLLFIQIFCPRSDMEAMQKGRQLSEIVKNAYRGVHTLNDVWFRNVRIKELEPEASFLQFQVIAEYEFSEER
jgi:hypothetical protein